MKRNTTSSDLNNSGTQELIKQIAFHEAGHAAAIHFNNEQEELPPIYYQIIIKPMHGLFDFPINPYRHVIDNCVAKLEGGRLVNSLPTPILRSGHLSEDEKHAYRSAYETDIVNLFSGPLAEAKYIAQRDDETFNSNLVNIQAMKFYGGTSDIETAYEYLNNFYCNRLQRAEKIDALFNKAHAFVNHYWHWQAIKALAEFILQSNQQIISCEQAGEIMLNAIASTKTHNMANYLQL